MIRIVTPLSQTTWARTAGIALLLIILCSAFSNDLIVAGDAAATARNIAAHETRFRIGIAGELLMLNGDVVLAVALYMLLRPIERGLALLGSFWRLANALLLAVGVVVSLVAVDLLDDPRYLAAFNAEQLQDLARALFDIHGTAMLVGLVLFGLGASIHASLLWRSRYIPRPLSGAYVVVAIVVVTGSVGIMLAPALDAWIDPWFILPDALIELLVALWLIVKGADVDALRRSEHRTIAVQ